MPQTLARDRPGMTLRGAALNHDNPIYLDHNASTPVLPEVVDAMLP
jgi:hypothetical protein